jgi:hypothetical protein
MDEELQRSLEMLNNLLAHREFFFKAENERKKLEQV